MSARRAWHGNIQTTHPGKANSEALDLEANRNVRDGQDGRVRAGDIRAGFSGTHGVHEVNLCTKLYRLPSVESSTGQEISTGSMISTTAGSIHTLVRGGDKTFGILRRVLQGLARRGTPNSGSMGEWTEQNIMSTQQCEFRP